MEWEVVIKLALAFVLGAVIGLEREVNEKRVAKPGQKADATLGLRTYSFICVLGVFSGFLYPQHMGLSLLIAGAALLLCLAFYIIDSLHTKDVGITTEIALIVTFAIGAMLSLEVLPIHIILAVTVVVTLLLSRKRNIKNVVDDIHFSQLNAFIAYAIIALVILPFLPNKSYGIDDIPGMVQFLETTGLDFDKIRGLDLFNPFKTWTIVALITGIDIIGYILERVIGQKKGWILASIAGGFVSSTAVTLSLAQQSKQAKRINHLLAAALVANLVSFFQIALLLLPVNAEFVIKLFPTFIAIIFACLMATFYFLRTKETDVQASREVVKIDETIFELGPALKFAGIYLLVGIVAKIALEYFGQGAFLLTIGLGSLAGLDAVMINTAQFAGGRIDYGLALAAFILANAVNLSGKTFYSFLQGKKEFAVKFGLSMAAVIGASLFSFFFV